ncbi:MAG TPA: hypothetical protein VKP30_27420 [Polyangiaceae bacterium]|nr:hypothetical protein [Polyangiaceae bacterium]
MKRRLLVGILILLAWTVVDLLLHRLLLEPYYAQSPTLWRPFDSLNVPLIYTVVFILIAVFICTYELLVQPKTLVSGVILGTLLGLALGVSAGFGTYLHMPVPLALAWGWLLGGWLKGIVAGALIGAMLRSTRRDGSADLGT